MPEWNHNDPRHRYAEILKIVAEIERIHPKIFDLRYADGRDNAERYIRKWYGLVSMAKLVTNRDRIQHAWALYDNAVISGQKRDMHQLDRSMIEELR
jgi:hypothetical protein